MHVLTGVQAAAVGEVQGALQAVRQVGDARAAPRRQVGGEEIRQLDPVGDLEGRSPHVRPKAAVPVLDREFDLSGG
ncbi:hypothetical protein [Streptomyces huasconensis]|uniref:hypothetical protein n=1 Tax=Streptomyces huasconensis TaxID=1854574 RepID=UPI0033DEC9B0